MELVIIKSIQYHFKILTNSYISQNEVKKFILPIINYINNNKSNKFLLSGSQGSGKTTLLKIIEIVLKKYFNKNVLPLSLDDFYFNIKERKKLARTVHPLLKTRGVPGTHDTDSLLKIIFKFDNLQYPIKFPVFDKLKDTTKNTKKIIRKKCDILILEGWCCGCSPLTDKYLFSNINVLEKKFDNNKKWRIYYNNQLKNSYSDLFNLFKKSIFIKIPSFLSVLKWRLKQENLLIKKNNSNKLLGYSNKEISDFIQHYEKISKWMLKTMPYKANLVLYLNKKHRFKYLKKK